MVEEDIESGEETSAQPSTSKGAAKKAPKRGIVYLSTIPPYMNVTSIREYFGEFGIVDRVYLQLQDPDSNKGEKAKKSKRKRVAKKFTEGWVEFERKSVAKKVAKQLNNTQVSTRKKSKQYDCIWNIKYLSNFKWTHLNERLAYERAVKRQRIRTEIQMAKKKNAVFGLNLGKKKTKDVINKEYEGIASTQDDDEGVEEMEVDRIESLKSLIG